MPTFLPQIFSGTAGSGRAVRITATAIATGTTVHTAVAGATAIDEVWIWAQNNSTADVELTIGFGGVTVPNDTIVLEVPFKSGLFLVVPGLRLNGGVIVKASAAEAGSISLFVNVNRYTA